MFNISAARAHQRVTTFLVPIPAQLSAAGVSRSVQTKRLIVVMVTTPLTLEYQKRSPSDQNSDRLETYGIAMSGPSPEERPQCSLVSKYSTSSGCSGTRVIPIGSIPNQTTFQDHFLSPQSQRKQIGFFALWQSEMTHKIRKTAQFELSGYDCILGQGLVSVWSVVSV